MAFIICQKHGGQGAAAVCPHVAAKIRHGEEVRDLRPCAVRYSEFKIGPIWCCRVCADHYEIPLGGVLLHGDHGIDRMFTTDWVPVCPLCFQALA